MLTVELRQEVADQVRQEAERRQVDLEELVNQWLLDQLWEEGNRKIEEEAQRFRKRHAELYAQYNGRYIAMQDGVVLDQDHDFMTLHDRIRAKYGDAPILMTLVSVEPIQTFNMWSTRYT